MRKINTFYRIGFKGYWRRSCNVQTEPMQIIQVMPCHIARIKALLAERRAA